MDRGRGGTDGARGPGRSRRRGTTTFGTQRRVAVPLCARINSHFTKRQISHPPRWRWQVQQAGDRPIASHPLSLTHPQFWYALSEDPPFAVKAVSPQFCIGHKARGPPPQPDPAGTAAAGVAGGGFASRLSAAAEGLSGWGGGNSSAAGKGRDRHWTVAATPDDDGYGTRGMRVRCELLQYATGLALGAGGRKLVLSYGVMDSVRWLSQLTHSRTFRYCHGQGTTASLK